MFVRRLAMVIAAIDLPVAAEKLTWEPPAAAAAGMAAKGRAAPPPPPPQRQPRAEPPAAASGCDGQRPWLAEAGQFDPVPQAYSQLGAVSRAEVVGCARLTQNKHALLDAASNPVALINPVWLMTPSRFDLVAKFIYARNRVLGRRSKWGLRLYAAHIAAFNGFQESDPPQAPKTSLLDFLLAFDRLLDGHRHSPTSWAANSTTFVPVAPTPSGAGGAGFGDATRGVAGVGGGVAITDGAHRLAASAVFGRPVLTVRIGGVSARYDAAFFRSRGLATPYLDNIATEWLRLHANAARVFLFWPSATSRPGAVAAALAVLAKHGEVVYERPLGGLWEGQGQRAEGGVPNTDGVLALLTTIYKGEDWLGAPSYGGALGKASRCFSTATGRPSPVHVAVFAPNAVAATEGAEEQTVEGGVNWVVRQAKQEIRALPLLEGLRNDAVHSTDDAGESLAVAELLLSAPGRQLLNHMRTEGVGGFEAWRKATMGVAAKVHAWVDKAGVTPDHVLVDGGSVLQAFGLRRAGDTDLLWVEPDSPAAAEKLRGKLQAAGFGDHNGYLQREDREDAIFNPERHFSLYGVKMLALEEVKRCKLARDEADFAKDILDVVGIDGLLALGDP